MPSAKLGLLRGLGGRTPSPLQARKPRCSPTSRSPMPDCALTFASLRPARPVSTSIWWQRKRSASALHLAPAESGQRKHEDACAQAKEAFARREEFQLHFSAGAPLAACPSQWGELRSGPRSNSLTASSRTVASPALARSQASA